MAPRGMASKQRFSADKSSSTTGGVHKPRKHSPPSRMRKTPSEINCGSIIRSIEEITSQFKGKYLKMFQDICFGHLIHLPEFRLLGHIVNNMLLRRKSPLKKHEEEEGMHFVIGNQEICFGRREFAMISGLRFQGGEGMDHKHRKIPLMEAHFPGQNSVKLRELIDKFNELEESEDKLKIGLLSIAEGVVMGHPASRVVNRRHFLLVDSLEDFNNYPWGKISYEETITSLIRASEKQDVSKRTLIGFPHIFQV
ncbi:hypothetical protein MKW92_010909 [Papaver armeniacum]|nr:hypothetical protein MKW92_010909 [Papaver armeniacum]